MLLQLLPLLRLQLQLAVEHSGLQLQQLGQLQHQQLLPVVVESCPPLHQH